jgi:prepilin-type N-terminal cleavage/methylation domain-containing protein
MALNNIKNLRKQGGFTIVELLIVIVVIAILATISIVAYTGIQNRAKTSAGNELASQVAKKLEAYYAINSAYPITRTELQGTPESKIDGVVTTGATSKPLYITAATGSTLFETTNLTGTTADGGQAVHIEGDATGGNVYYWDYTGTAAEKSIKYGP